MIGQKYLIESINNIIQRFPRFSIIVGDKGSGKKTLCKEISKLLKVKPVFVGTKIDDIRQAIDMAYTQFEPIAYIISDADNMSLAAKNSMLKITEEPCKSSYFILTLENLDNTLQTIRSRGTVFQLDDYTAQDIINYRVFRGYKPDYDEIIKKICTTTGQVDEVFGYNINEFYNFCKAVAENIQVPVNGNAFKITNKLKTKETDEGYDVRLFLHTVNTLFFEKGKKDKKYLKASIETMTTSQQLRNVTVNKLGLMDMWIMNVRSVLRG